MVVTGSTRYVVILANHQKDHLLVMSSQRQDLPPPPFPSKKKARARAHTHAHTKRLYSDDEEGPFSSFFLLSLDKSMNIIV